MQVRIIKIRAWDLQYEHVRWLCGLDWSPLGCTVASMCRCPTSPADASLGQLRVTGWQTERNQGSQGLRENVCSRGLNVASKWTHAFRFQFANRRGRKPNIDFGDDNYSRFSQEQFLRGTPKRLAAVTLLFNTLPLCQLRKFIIPSEGNFN